MKMALARSTGSAVSAPSGARLSLHADEACTQAKVVAVVVVTLQQLQCQKLMVAMLLSNP